VGLDNKTHSEGNQLDSRIHLVFLNNKIPDLKIHLQHKIGNQLSSQINSQLTKDKLLHPCNSHNLPQVNKWLDKQPSHSKINISNNTLLKLRLKITSITHCSVLINRSLGAPLRDFQTLSNYVMNHTFHWDLLSNLTVS